ncbi:MAG: von Willebrand factor type A domain-containing protein [Rhizobiaceae bacterium]|nr:von Willebrand factor type A domain-containing protein [Rhizobiaceae bacterium]MCV0406638.1 von Willebrand factor type A domain-containing protein [Rhizobiaceae bacterium]
MTSRNEYDPLEMLRDAHAPAPDEAARRKALSAALSAYDEEIARAPQGKAAPRRPSAGTQSFWSRIMNRHFLATPAIAGLLALPLAGYAAFWLSGTSPFAVDRETRVEQQPAATRPLEREAAAVNSGKAETSDHDARRSRQARSPAPAEEQARDGADEEASADYAQPPVGLVAPQAAAPEMMTRAPAAIVAPDPMPVPRLEEGRDRLTEFSTNLVKAVAEEPVSTFAIDTDTASYSWVRRSLKEGVMPQPDTVRVEEMINYFPYDWAGPESAETPFRANVSVMPTPWNAGTKLMHVAIKGYDVAPASRPRANLVFLIDVSGSMDEPDKLPLLKSSFRLLVSRLSDDDTVSIVTYAGNAGTVLEPTRGSEKARILAAIDGLRPGGSTAGEAGLRQAYDLARQAYIEGGVNRVMLATDGDFNVGQSSDEELKRLIEDRRESGVFLSVLGFGRGNLNDRMMQTIAQNGNGTAAYIDTLAEAEKTLVQEAGSTLFPIAKDVKVQVEFNPAAIAEYRLIGYETRALNREDFNDDRVDAGEIGSGHSVTAIYEITPKDSPARRIDDLRYGEATVTGEGVANAGEYAFVKIRYKLPNEDVSKLIEQPVTRANELPSFDAASADQRFSVAVAAFGQKLRKTSQLAGMDWEAIAGLASASRGDDPYGYRGEMLSLVRLAAALDGRNEHGDP